MCALIYINAKMSMYCLRDVLSLKETSLTALSFTEQVMAIDPPPPFESIPDLSQISVEAVSSILKKLPHKAPGPDSIPN